MKGLPKKGRNNSNQATLTSRNLSVNITRVSQRLRTGGNPTISPSASQQQATTALRTPLFESRTLAAHPNRKPLSTSSLPRKPQNRPIRRPQQDLPSPSATAPLHHSPYCVSMAYLLTNHRRYQQPTQRDLKDTCS
ncbi:hypothetical protein N431DRAFT_192351 [Stipitochalara longipes BDJ]|nr:hypothetical protein N431DRAFT_192351 [Stipitochalara longipes BDJ]